MAEKKLHLPFNLELLTLCSGWAFFGQPWESWVCCFSLCTGLSAWDCSMVCLGRAGACSLGARALRTQQRGGVVAWAPLRWEAACPCSSPFPSLSCDKGALLIRKLREQRARRVYPSWSVHLVLSVPREIWLQGRASKPDELFWQVWVVLPARLVFRGFPISLNAEHSCGRILFVCFLKCGDLSFANRRSCSRVGGPDLGWRH